LQEVVLPSADPKTGLCIEKRGHFHPHSEQPEE